MIKLGFLASGNGTSIEALVNKIKSKELDGFEARVIICNKTAGEAGVYERARKLDIPIKHLVNPSDQLELFRDYHVELVLAMGYLKVIGNELLNYFEERIWNIHPALLPKYGGKGMYGLNVHKAVIESGDKETGATVHVVNEHYDKGEILNQVKIPVFKNEGPEMLQKRVLKFEYVLMATTLGLYRDNLLPKCKRPRH